MTYQLQEKELEEIIMNKVESILLDLFNGFNF